MDGATIQARIAKGYAIAGGKLGTAHALHRPFDPLRPICLLSRVATLTAAFDSGQAFAFGKPNEYGDSKWYGLFDTARTQPGDYLIGTAGAWFIAAQQPLLPTLCVGTNATVSVLRLATNSAAGLQGYGGHNVAAETVIAAGWPASVLRRGAGQVPSAGIPGDPPAGSFDVLLPAIPAVSIARADMVADDLGRRFTVTNAELTDLGWRLMVQQAVV